MDVLSDGVETVSLPEESSMTDPHMLNKSFETHGIEEKHGVWTGNTRLSDDLIEVFDAFFAVFLGLRGCLIQTNVFVQRILGDEALVLRTLGERGHVSASLGLQTTFCSKLPDAREIVTPMRNSWCISHVNRRSGFKLRVQTGKMILLRSVHPIRDIAPKSLAIIIVIAPLSQLVKHLLGTIRHPASRQLTKVIDSQTRCWVFHPTTCSIIKNLAWMKGKVVTREEKFPQLTGRRETLTEDPKGV